ncbi:hypothetical protein T484DRAFT_1923193 [Baffinella frigidus]|nr:hypothetical protein T484DRAFT_1923193 [Cryptophyta sp. CCMP2293]
MEEAGSADSPSAMDAAALDVAAMVRALDEQLKSTIEQRSRLERDANSEVGSETPSPLAKTGVSSTLLDRRHSDAEMEREVEKGARERAGEGVGSMTLSFSRGKQLPYVDDKRAV